MTGRRHSRQDRISVLWFPADLAAFPIPGERAGPSIVPSLGRSTLAHPAIEEQILDPPV
jgi:hypothetical protein